MSSVSVHVHRMDIVLRNLKAIGGGAPRYMSATMKEIMDKAVWPKWLEHTSLTDHTLADLARLGYPYSKKFAPDSFAHPDDYVHAQSHKLLNRSHELFATAGNQVSARIVNTSAEYVHLRYGTRYMRPRDPGGAAITEAMPDVKRIFTERVKQAIVQIYTEK